MKTTRTIAGWLMLLALSTFSPQLTTAFAQGTTAFTYQGQLHDGGTNANGSYTMIFALYDAASGGNQIGSAITSSPTLVNGLFSVNLDFGAAPFNGTTRWLDITVSNGVAQTLSPRVQVLPAPYAIYAAVAATVTNGAIMNAQLAGNAVATTNIQNNAITTVLIANSAVTNRNIASNSVTSDKLALDSAGLARVTGGAAFVANNVVSFTGGQVTMTHNFGANGNSVWNIENGYSDVIGVPGSFIDNLFFFGPSGLPAAQIWDQPGLGARGISAPNVFGNTVSAGNIFATGNLSLQQGTAGATIWNVNIGTFRDAYGNNYPNSLLFSAAGVTTMVMVANQGVGVLGSFNATGKVKAGGDLAGNRLVLGPDDCEYTIELEGSCSGYTAIKADSNFHVTGSLQVDQSITANGGISASGDINSGGTICGNFCNADNVVAGNVSAKTLNTASDRNLKEKFAPIDNQEILERVAGLPISRWNFKTDGKTQHIGPMAQDFHAAFNVGTDDKHIATVDEGGVALAAIQGLNEKLKEKDARIEALEKRLADLEQLVKTSTKK